MNKKEELLNHSNNVHNLLTNIESTQGRRKVKNWIIRWWYFLTFRGYKNA